MKSMHRILAPDTAEKFPCLMIAAMAALLLAAPPAHATAAEESFFFTNYDSHFNARDNMQRIPVPIGIYDMGFTVYSREFAERFGYPPEHIAQLDPGMQALEFRMHTNGGFVECHLNTLLDNTLGLDLPEHDYASRFEQQGDMMRFPQKLGSYKDEKGHYAERPEDKEFRMNVRQEKWHYYSRNIHLASYDYAPGKKGTWTAGQMLEGYTGKYIKGLDYVSVNTGCTALTHEHFLRKDISLWLKKKGGDDYSLKLGTKPEQFVKFRLPLPFTQKAAETMKPYLKTGYSFFKGIKEQSGGDHE